MYSRSTSAADATGSKTPLTFTGENVMDCDNTLPPHTLGTRTDSLSDYFPMVRTVSCPPFPSAGASCIEDEEVESAIVGRVLSEEVQAAAPTLASSATPSADQASPMEVVVAPTDPSCTLPEDMKATATAVAAAYTPPAVLHEETPMSSAVVVAGRQHYSSARPTEANTLVFVADTTTAEQLAAVLRSASGDAGGKMAFVHGVSVVYGKNNDDTFVCDVRLRAFFELLLQARALVDGEAFDDVELYFFGTGKFKSFDLDAVKNGGMYLPRGVWDPEHMPNEVVFAMRLCPGLCHQFYIYGKVPYSNFASELAAIDGKLIEYIHEEDLPKLMPALQAMMEAKVDDRETLIQYMKLLLSIVYPANMADANDRKSLIRACASVAPAISLNLDEYQPSSAAGVDGALSSVFGNNNKMRRTQESEDAPTARTGSNSSQVEDEETGFVFRYTDELLFDGNVRTTSDINDLPGMFLESMTERFRRIPAGQSKEVKALGQKALLPYRFFNVDQATGMPPIAHGNLFDNSGFGTLGCKARLGTNVFTQAIGFLASAVSKPRFMELLRMPGVDIFEAAAKINDDKVKGKILVTDRFWGSGHSPAKLGPIARLVDSPKFDPATGKYIPGSGKEIVGNSSLRHGYMLAASAVRMDAPSKSLLEILDLSAPAVNPDGTADIQAVRRAISRLLVKALTPFLSQA